MKKSANESDTTKANSSQSFNGSEKEKQRLEEILSFDLQNFDMEDKGLLSITKLVTINSKTAMGFVSIVDDTYINLISKYGCTTELEPRHSKKNSFCSVVLEKGGLLEVCDSLLDERFIESDWVKSSDYPIRFYAGFPLITPNGNILGTLCVMDFKPHKLDENQILTLKFLAENVVINLELRKQQKLNDAFERAEKISKAKDNFVSNMSHELRTPLNAINGFVDILSKTHLNEAQKEAVTIIKSCCEILIIQINDILDLLKIDSGVLALQKSQFNLAEAIISIKNLLGKNALKNENEINFFVDSKIPSKIIGDKIRINQVIMNLVGNAIKFTNKGYVSLEVNLKEESNSQVILDFSIKDTGIGIPDDKLESIFERFEQVDQEISHKYGGAGLGLIISKNLVELHDSKINIRSVLGKGSEFYFTIAFDKITKDEEEILMNPNLNQNLNKLPNSDYLKNIKILVCEDNVINIKLIRNLFKNKLAHMEVAENGKVAIDILNKDKDFDVILMDIHMPEMDGIETTIYIRNTMYLTMPIIGFTANSSEIEKELCLKNGMTDYIAKSFVFEEFHESFSKSLSIKKIYDEDPFIKLKVPKRRSSHYPTTIHIDKCQKIFKNKDNEIKHPTKHLSCKHINYHTRNYIRSNTRYNSLFVPSITETNFTNEEEEEEEEEEETNIIENNYNNAVEINYIDFKIKNKNVVSKQSNTSLISLHESSSSDDSLDINENIIKNIKEISCDDEKFEKEFIEIFLKESPLEMGNLETAINLKNLESIHFIVHKMKSPLLMLGLNKIFDKIICIEKDFLKNDYCVTIDMFNKVKQDIEAHYKFLNNHYIINI